MLTRYPTKALSLLALIGLTLAGSGCGSTDAQAEYEAPKVREAPVCITEDDAVRLADQVLQLVNLERAAIAMPPVTISSQLSLIAETYACRMIEEGFFDHWDPLTDHGPADRAVAGKYRFYAVGENLAVGQQSPAEVMKEWMESPAHHDMILNPKWTEIGIAVRTGGEHSIYWVQMFGQPITGS